MNKIVYVILREYFTRIKERSFILAMIFIPLFMIFILMLPTYLSKMDSNTQRVAFFSNIKDLEKEIRQSSPEIECYESINIDSIKKVVLAGSFSEAICVEIQDDDFIKCLLFYKNEVAFPICHEIETIIQNYYLSTLFGVDYNSNIAENIRIMGKIKLQKIQLGDGVGQDSSIKEAMCLFLGFIVYMLIFLFSTHVMRGVQEEKSNRIAEVIMTSISPFQFIAGKVVGIALLGLTQIIIWFIFIFIVVHFWTPVDLPINNVMDAMHKNQYEQIQLIIEYIRVVDLATIIPVCVLFFILGFFLYSSMFAVLGTISKTEGSQQLMFFVSSPLILSIVLLSEVIRKPDGLVTHIFSMIPFTSPVVMVGRCVYSVTAKEIIISLSILLISTICVIFIAGKIYRSAILYTGKQSVVDNIIYWFNIKR